MARRLLALLGRMATPALAAGLFLGLLAPPLARLLQPLLLPAVVVLLFLSLLRLDWSLLAVHVRRPGVVLLAVFWQLLASPLLAHGAGTAVGLPPGLLTALTLNAAAAPVMSSAAFAQILRLDAAVSVVVTVAGTLLMPLTVAPTAFWLLDLDLPVDAAGFLARAGVFILLPFAAAFAVRRAVPAMILQRHDDAIAGATVLTLLVFAVAVMDGMAARLAAGPGTVLLFLAVAVGANLFFQLAGTVLFRPAGRPLAASIGLMSGNRNMGLMLGLAGGLGSSDLLLYLAVAQVPIYLSPLLAGPFYRRFVGVRGEM